MEDVASEYASSLHDLTTNSKPLISMLTMLAEEYRLHAPSIVKVIEDYLKRSCPKIKLPTLYLIDSIIKNVGDPYNKLFTENIIKVFLDVFQEGDEKIRSALYKLRQTWKGLLPDVKLYMIDALTKKIDPNWPICPSLEHLASSIHLNPKFFGRQPPTIEITQRLECESVRKDTIAPVKDAVSPAEMKMIEQQSKQRHGRTVSEGQTVLLERETGDDVRSSDSLASRTTEQRRSDPRLKRRHDQQLFEHQLLQPDVVMAEKVKGNSDVSSTGSKDSSSSSGSKRSEKKFSSAKRSRSSDKEQQRANGKRPTSEGHVDTNKDRSTSSKSIKDKSSSSSTGDRKSSRSNSSACNKKSPKFPRSSSDKSGTNQQMSSDGRSPSKSPSSFYSGRSGEAVGADTSIAPSFADKEAAAILTGDIDLRILEPITKKPKTENSATSEPPPVLMDVFPKGDIDLRIRPAGGVSDPGQPLLNSVTSALSSDRDVKTAVDTTGTSDSRTRTQDEDDDDDEFDKESQWAKLKGRPVRNPIAELALERGIKKEASSGDRLATATKEYSSSSQINDPLSSLPLRGAAVRPTVPDIEAVRGTSTVSLPQTGARLPLASLPIVDVTPKQNAIPDLFPPGRSRAHIKISDPAPDSGQIRLDGRMREVRFVDGVAIAVMDEAPPNFVRARQIMFKGGSSKKILINEHHQIMAAFDGREHEFTLNGNRHRIRFGAPLRELYVDGIPYSCQFNGVPVYIRSREDVFSVTLHPPCPSVNDKMEAPKELLAKLGLLPMSPEAPAIGPGGCVVGVIPPGGQVPLAPMAAPLGGAAPSHLVGGPSTGVSLSANWGIRDREPQNAEAQQREGPAESHGSNSIFFAKRVLSSVTTFARKYDVVPVLLSCSV